MSLVRASSLLALFLAGLAGCGSWVKLVEGIPADAAAPAADTGGDDAAAETEDDAADPDAPGDGDQGDNQDGGINDNDGGGVDCGAVGGDGDTGPPDGAC